MSFRPPFLPELWQRYGVSIIPTPGGRWLARQRWERGAALPPVVGPCGHLVHSNARLLRGESCLECNHRESPGGPRCGMNTLVGAGMLDTDGKPFRLLAHVHDREVARIERERMSNEAMLDYLRTTPYPE